MDHPYVHKYRETYKEVNGLDCQPLEEIIIRIKASLKRHYDIMDLHWASLAEVLDVPRDTYSRVYREGWSLDSDTKRLREIFEQMVSPVDLDKALEDYL